jgi:hypothetical protein
MAASDATPPETARGAALEKGAGALDGFTFTTTLAPEGKLATGEAAIRDAMFFREGRFASMECEDRCNYPPSAYFSRAVPGGQEFIVEAWCPTKNAMMVWRGQITGDAVAGTVTWSVRRFYWRISMVLEFEGARATEQEVALWRP